MTEPDQLRTEVEQRLLAIERLGAGLRLEAVVATQLSIQQLKVLMLAVHRSPVSGHEVATTLDVTPATVSGLVARLVDAGLLVQEPSSEDRR
ncbi:MarR family winged helix-turn-helix transcriptional regulator, partial [Nocardioides massiliensis]